jgi:hypothetical protein
LQQGSGAQHEGSAPQLGSAAHVGSAAHEGAAAQVASQAGAQHEGLQQRLRWQRFTRWHFFRQQGSGAQQLGSAAHDGAAQHEGSAAQHDGSQQPPPPPKMRACAFEAVTTNRPATNSAGNKMRDFMTRTPKQKLEGFPSIRCRASQMPLAHCSAVIQAGWTATLDALPAGEPR